MIKVVGIKFKTGGKLYYFSPKAGDKYERNMPVVVETSRGLEYAWVAYPEKEVSDRRSRVNDRKNLSQTVFYCKIRKGNKNEIHK